MKLLLTLMKKEEKSIRGEKVKREKPFDVVIEYHVRVEAKTKKGAEGIAVEWFFDDVNKPRRVPNFVIKVNEAKE